MSELRGKLRQKIPGGPYYYRLMVANNVRREFSLKTCVFEEAVQKAADLDVIWSAPTQEVAIAQINALKGYSQESKNLPFDEAWRLYEVHPDRAMPHTVSEQNAYRSTFDEFVQFVSKPFPGRKKHTIAGGIAEVSPQVCEEFSSYLKTTSLAVDTHNRKIKRLRKIFDCLKEYFAGENPFRSKALLRSEREERGTVVHRQAFTKEQEEQLIAVLSDDDPKHKIMNKDEIRVLYVIGRFTGQRLKDCVLLQWQNIDMSNRRLWVKQFKTGKEVTIPMAPELYTALIEARKWRTDHDVKNVLSGNSPANAGLINAGDITELDYGIILECRHKIQYLWHAREPESRNQFAEVFHLLADAKKKGIDASILRYDGLASTQENLDLAAARQQALRYGLDIPATLRDSGYVHVPTTQKEFVPRDIPFFWTNGSSTLFFGSECMTLMKHLLSAFNRISIGAQDVAKTMPKPEKTDMCSGVFPQKKVAIFYPAEVESLRDAKQSPPHLEVTGFE